PRRHIHADSRARHRHVRLANHLPGRNRTAARPNPASQPDSLAHDNAFTREPRHAAKLIPGNRHIHILDSTAADRRPSALAHLHASELRTTPGAGLSAARPGFGHALKRAASSDPPVASPGLYECAPVPASWPPWTIRYSSRIGRFSNQHST